MNSNDTPNPTFEQAQAAFEEIQLALPNIPEANNSLEILGAYLDRITVSNDHLSRHALSFRQMFEDNKRALLQHGYEQAVTNIISDPTEAQLAKMASPYAQEAPFA